MSDASIEAVQLWREELKLCKVGPGQTVAILAPGGDAMQDRAQGFLAAALELGADAYVVTLPGPRMELYGLGSTPLTGRPQVIELLKGADLIVDLVLLLFSKEQLELQAAGCRVLLCVEPLPILQRLLPTPELKERVLAAAADLEKAKRMHITSDAGTDVEFELGHYPILVEYGFADEPGRWDHFPGGFLATHGSDDGVNGTVVLDTGDVLLLPQMRYVEDPIGLTIENGYVTKIEGKGLDAVFMLDFLPSQDEDREAWAVSHIGWGLNREARWSMHNVPGEFGMNQRAFWGNVQFSTGPNTELGGTRETPYHLDIPMRNCSLWLDDKQVLDKGKVVVPEYA
jgi:2,5-dihydroxypyridine 5,6-dioxygenase